MQKRAGIWLPWLKKGNHNVSLVGLEGVRNVLFVNPRRIRLDASTICQLQCPLCPNANGAIDGSVGKGVLRFDHFRHLLEKNPQVKQVELSNWGEVFLNGELIDIMKFSYDRGIALSVFNGSNFNKLSEDLLEALVRYGLFFLSCSIDGASSETYARYRVGGNLETVLKNIERINHYKKILKSPYPILQWQLVIFDHNRTEIETARKMALHYHMLFTTKINWSTDRFQISKKGIEEGFDGPTTTEAFLMKYHRPYHRRSCYQLWNEPQINWDGRVFGCCENARFDFGANAFDDGLLKSVNNEKMVYSRQMLLGNLPKRNDVPCAHCAKYEEMQQGECYLNGTEIYLDRLRSLGPFFVMFKTPVFHRCLNSAMTHGRPVLKRTLKYIDIPFQ